MEHQVPSSRSGFRRHPASISTADPETRRGKILAVLPNQARNHFVAFIGEIVGTFLFLFFAFAGTQVANTAAANISAVNPSLTGSEDVGVVMFISLSFGFSLAVNAWVFFRISGGLFNPAVTLALCLVGAVDWVRGIVVFIAQLCGAFAASGIALGLFPGELSVRTTLSQGTGVAQGLFIEMFATFQLVFCIIMLAAEKHKSTFLAPIGIGLSLFISELGSVPFTGGSLNPARSFGPAVILGIFTRYHWIYWLGPVLGALLAVGLYKLVKALDYETANPGQDFDDMEHHIFTQRNNEGESSTISQHADGHTVTSDEEKGFASMVGFGNGGMSDRHLALRPIVSAESRAALVRKASEQQLGVREQASSAAMRQESEVQSGSRQGDQQPVPTSLNGVTRAGG